MCDRWMYDNMNEQFLDVVTSLTSSVFHVMITIHLDYFSLLNLL